MSGFIRTFTYSLNTLASEGNAAKNIGELRQAYSNYGSNFFRDPTTYDSFSDEQLMSMSGRTDLAGTSTSTSKNSPTSSKAESVETSTDNINSNKSNTNASTISANRRRRPGVTDSIVNLKPETESTTLLGG